MSATLTFSDELNDNFRFDSIFTDASTTFLPPIAAGSDTYKCINSAPINGVENISATYSGTFDSATSTTGAASIDVLVVSDSVGQIFKLTLDSPLAISDMKAFHISGRAAAAFLLSGNDTLNGSVDSDYIEGFAGADTLTGGGGADSFAFNLKTHSPKGAGHDIITDFSGVVGGEHDRINVHGIDANTHLHGNQNFHFIRAQHFHRTAGELHFVKHGTFVTVEGDINGNGKADFQIEVHNLTDNLHGLVKGDFVL